LPRDDIDGKKMATLLGVSDSKSIFFYTQAALYAAISFKIEFFKLLFHYFYI
jgi:hypothetical protein